MVTFINGLTASAVTSPSDWPAGMQIEQLRLQLDLLRQWANTQLTGAGQGQAKAANTKVARRAG
jgi:hypothetical protein